MYSGVFQTKCNSGSRLSWDHLLFAVSVALLYNFICCKPGKMEEATQLKCSLTLSVYAACHIPGLRTESFMQVTPKSSGSAEQEICLYVDPAKLGYIHRKPKQG